MNALETLRTMRLREVGVMGDAVETKTCGSDQVRNAIFVQSNCELEDIES